MDNLVELYVAGMENPVSVDARWESSNEKARAKREICSRARASTLLGQLGITCN